MKLAMKLLLFLVVVLCLVGSASAATYYISDTDSFLDGDTFCSGTCNPGDILIIESGERDWITFKDFFGAYGNPIIIKNDGELVHVNATIGYAVQIRNSEYIKVSGAGNLSNYTYGIKISNSSTGGIFGYRKTDEIEFKNLEITSTNIGISVKTYEDEDGNPVNRTNWKQYNTTIHDCYIHDLPHGEGLYIGSSNWGGGESPELDGLYIYDNIVENIGFDGIQLNGATDNVSVHHNYINNTGFSTEGSPPTGANNIVGLLIGDGMQGDFYNNKIYNSGGRGIYVGTGPGSIEIYNNLVAHTGVHGWASYSNGITLHNNALVRYNTVVNVTNYGIRVNTGVVDVRDNLIAVYGDGPTIGGNVSNNLESSTYAGAGFVDYANDDYHITSSSPAVDNTSALSYPSTDLDDVSRPVGSYPDLGAYEYTGAAAPSSYDNNIRSSAPDTVVNDTTNFGVGQIGPVNKYRSWIWFNLSEYNSTDTITVANLSLYWYYNTSARNKSTNVGIYLSNATTDTDYLTWNNSSNGVAWREPGGNWLDATWADNGTTPFDSILFPDTAADDSLHVFDITELVQSIVNESRTNNGFFIIGNETDTNYIAFSSLDNATEAHRPTLNITHAIADDGAPSATDFGLYKIITINHTMVNQSIGTGIYPLLVSTTDTDLLVCQADGDDIVFFDADNTTLLPYEQEFWNSTNGELVEHVGVTDVTNVTYIVMYYNNSTIANSENATGVWDSNFKVVQHLNETPVGTTYDSTSNNNDGTTVGMDSADQVAGQVDGSLDLDGADRISLTSLPVENNAAFTISTWMNGTAGGIAYGEGYSGDDAWAMFLGIDPNSPYSARFYYKESGSWKALTTGTTQVNDTWHHVVLSQASKSSRTIYIDGVAEETDTDAVGDMSTLDTTNIGVLERATFGSYFTGQIDELRISDTARSAEWTETEYNNTAYPALFISIGAEQGAGAPDTKFEYWTGSAWEENPEDYHLWFECFWNTSGYPDGVCQNAEQSGSQYSLRITNNGSAAGTSNIKFNESSPAEVTVYIDDDYTVAGATIITDSYQEIGPELQPGENVTLSAWVKLENLASVWEFITYVEVQ